MESGRRLPDWEVLQEVMDEAFHRRGDAYPRGSAEHKAVQEFIPKLAKVLAGRRQRLESSPTADDDAGGDDSSLGLPSSYDSRYRVNTAIVAEPQAVKTALLAAQRSSRAASIRDAAGVEGLGAAVERYQTMLAHYEDFRQKKAYAKLLKLQADQKALPIAPFEAHIVGALSQHQVIVLAGDTGCGKSTQLPQFLLRAGYSKIAVTQPRRISAMSLCRRVSYETLNEHGDEVAYQIRFDSSRGTGTKVTFMTEGILLRRLAGDPDLRDFDCIVLDEVHERHLSTDFLLALLRAIVMQRPALRVVLMSATINVAAYSTYFGGVPIISVPGRLHPIKVVYLPPPPNHSGGGRGWGHSAGDGGGGKRSREEANARVAKGGRRIIERISPAPYVDVLRRIDTEVPRGERGDVLVFLSGMDDISTVADAMEEYAAQTKRWVVLKLHSSLAMEEQDRVFDVAEPGVRKVILSTNIAETSVTIDGIRFVVDSGRCKEILFDYAGGQVGSLQEGWVSRASAEQRKGRAGRTGPGVCYRLYSESDFSCFPPFNIPEIQRVRLESVILQIKQLAGGGMDPRQFGFIDPPSRGGLDAAVASLKAAQALDEREALTPLGAILASLPVDIHIGKMLVLGCVLGCFEAVLTIAAALSVQSPFLRASGNEASRRAEIESAEGDPFSLFHLFEEWIRIKNEQKSGQRVSSRKWCQQRGVEEQRMYEIAKLRRQFDDLLRTAGLTARPLDKSHRGRDDASGDLDVGKLPHWSRMGRRDKRAAPSSSHRPSKTWLRKMRQKLDQQSRSTRVLHATGAGDDDDDGGNDEGGDIGSGDEKDDDKGRRVPSEFGGQLSAEALKQLDLELTVDVAGLAAAAGAALTRGDVCLLKFVISSALYPNIALPAVGNMHWRGADMRFHLPNGKDASLHPSSGLVARSRELDATCGVVYVEALETRSLFMCNNTPVPALPALLLSASRMDTNLDASRIMVDRWLLLRIQGGDGPKVLFSVAKARRALTRLMGAKLRSSLQRRRHRPDDPSEEDGSALASEVARDAPSFLDAEAAEHQGLAPDYLNELPPWVSHVSGAWSEPQGAAESAGEVAEQLAAAFVWPVRYTVERIAGSAAAAQYNNGNAGGDNDVDGETEEGGVRVKEESSKAKGCGGGGDGGHDITPWLCVGSLRGVESGLAAHATLPALRRHWHCPGCHAKLIATAEDIAAHVELCASATKLEPGVLENSYGGHQVATSSRSTIKEEPMFEGDWKRGAGEAIVLSRARDPTSASHAGRPSRRDGDASADNGAERRGDREPRRADEARQHYYCHWCSSSLVLSATEFLKHKQLHKRDGD